MSTPIDVLTTIEITVGDTGITLSGQLNGGGLTTLAGATITLSLLGIDEQLRLTGRDRLTTASATLTDGPNRKVSYKLQAADVATPGRFAIRWTVTLPAGAGDVHVPGPKGQYVILQINA
jgi:hypothetical protein